METRQLGNSGLFVPVLSLGTGTFGGVGDFFKRWGSTEMKEATEMVDICLDAGLNFFDTADVYSEGRSEEVLGAAIKGRRDKVLISTKATFPMGEGPNGRGSSRAYLMKACEASLKRLGTDYIDIYFMHGPDLNTPVEETLRALDDLVSSGKVRYIGCSNYSGWHLMKSLAVSKEQGLHRFAVYQGYYSLVGRDYEWELMPCCEDQGVATMVWSPLGWARLTGKIKRGQPPEDGRIASGGEVGGPRIEEDYLYDVIDVLEEVARETDRTIPQVALNWLLTRPTVANLVIGARNPLQLKQNIEAVGWKLTPDQIERLDKASHRHPSYPYWHQMGYPEICPQPTPW